MSEPVAGTTPEGLPVGGSADQRLGLAGRFSKTEAGRQEIRLRALPLSRPARNLLLIIDASRSAAEWLGLVQGCDHAALQALQDAGLIANTVPTGAGAAGAAAAIAAGGSPAEQAAAAGAATAAPPRMSLAQALEHRSYQALHQRITAEARPRLGLFKSYKLILEVDRCAGPAEIRALAQRFVEQVRELDGDVAGMALAQVLIEPE